MLLPFSDLCCEERYWALFPTLNGTLDGMTLVLRCRLIYEQHCNVREQTGRGCRGRGEGRAGA